MTPLHQGRITDLLTACHDHKASNTRKGRALEALAAELFSNIPGVRLTLANNKDAFDTQEIDLAVYNGEASNGLAGFPQVFLIECKNWSKPVGSMEVAWFDTKLRLKGCSFGVLLALKGITGKSHSLTAAHYIVASALREHRSLVVLKEDHIAGLTDTDEVVRLLQRRMTEIRVSRPF
jgi:hypothetical protein